MTTIHNPILPGFNPDPSICRVGDDYYIATSTFEWYPGVQIHHSRDLANWRLAQRSRSNAPPSSTCAASPIPAASGRLAFPGPTVLFWLVYTDVKRFDGNFKDAHNYIVTAPAMGPWSDPTYLNSSGFDPSLFHDDETRNWFLNMIWNHRPDPGGGPRTSGLFGHPPPGMGRRLRQAGRTIPQTSSPEARTASSKVRILASATAGII